jgi:hypothetical protein
MKTFTKTMLFALSLGAFFGATSAKAQDYRLNVDIPFQFMADGKMYPAGDYNFIVDTTVHTLKIQSPGDKNMHMLALTPGGDRRPGLSPERGGVRFAKTGNLNVLTGVWQAGSFYGSVNSGMKALREAARADAATAGNLN